ncbi:hypothetical protein [Candidatus Methanoperedens nitratireducens]|uniref:Uncharacterized protein n=1 Tax=Candidatus Methanoperedens nitratireducens TaxID=1392998 RepID=A0A284VU36_9EURY|nr:hypothetical protein [Candidatus Methanoperedens nitroreducens]SNQ62800.1 hypothetical protein MNV_90014 [Candidatus Methanoperedens nitroreducens]
MVLISRLYEWKLKAEIKKQEVPKNIVLALSESDLLADAGLMNFGLLFPGAKRPGSIQ